jgi:hypothetical protein
MGVITREHGPACAARAAVEAASSAGEILLRRQPTVPIDLDTGHVGIAALAW